MSVTRSGRSSWSLGGSGHAVGSDATHVAPPMRLLFLFNRKMTISKNALKPSSRTLSSSTEKSECVVVIFLKEKKLSPPTSPPNPVSRRNWGASA